MEAKKGVIPTSTTTLEKGTLSMGLTYVFRFHMMAIVFCDDKGDDAIFTNRRDSHDDNWQKF